MLLAMNLLGFKIQGVTRTRFGHGQMKDTVLVPKLYLNHGTLTLILFLYSKEYNLIQFYIVHLH